MTKLKAFYNYFSKGEKILWMLSVFAVVSSFCIFDRANFVNLAASVIGVTSLIFCAKGNPFGPVLMILFSLVYAAISLGYSYYGEMITYLGMSAPMAFFAFVSWLKNPFKENKSEVRVDKLMKNDVFVMIALTVAVTLIFYFILKAFNTANLMPSTLSVTTSFIAVYLTYKRSEYYALAYAANDIVLIVLWVMASLEDLMYLSVVVCFVTFLINDLYGFVSWRKMYLRQNT